MRISTGLIYGPLLSIASSRVLSHTKRDASAFRESYDFIIAGGGIVGLTVADRLSAAFPNKTVLVIEYGENNYAPGNFDPPTTSFGNPKSTANETRASTATSFAVAHLPIKDLAWRVGSVIIGKALGGGGAINGQFFDRGHRLDYDLWASVSSNDRFDSATRWDWEGIFPFFKKSVTFTPPPETVATKYGYTWDTSAWDNVTAINAMLPPFQWGDHSIARKAWKELGIQETKECALGDKEGICWVPTAQDPVTARRSHAALAHYNDTRRSNYDLLPLHQVIRVVYPDGPSKGPPLVEVRSLADTGRVFNITAKADVILSAGAIHTPPILQRSGIGHDKFLDSVGVKTVINLPGVGSNYQDHWGPDISWAYNDTAKFNRDFWPLPSELKDNTTFYNDALAGFDETPARGPYTLAGSQTGMWLPLANMTSSWQAITDRIRSIAASSAADYLPPDSDPTIIEGYKAQLRAIADYLAHPHAPSMETAFGSGTILKIFIMKPLSRGTVRINPSAPLDMPVLDTRLASNPVDMDMSVAHLRWFRSTFLQTRVMRDLGAYATVPPASLDNNDDEALRKYIRETSSLSLAHPCCTAPMMPEQHGGVVDSHLNVYSATGLRVADMSIIPMQVSAHLSATAYAVGEKAASIIIDDWKRSWGQ